MNEQEIYAGLSYGLELKKFGIDGLRVQIVSNSWKTNSPQMHAEAVEVVRRFDASTIAATLAIRDSREARTLAIAEDALSEAKSANRIALSNSIEAKRATRWAMYAQIIAVIAITIAVKDQILALVFNS
jgi:hypothetical protein